MSEDKNSNQNETNDIFTNYKTQDIEKKCINFNKKYINITNAILFDKNVKKNIIHLWKYNIKINYLFWLQEIILMLFNILGNAKIIEK